MTDMPPIDEQPPAPHTQAEGKGIEAMSAEHKPTAENCAKVIALACNGHNQTRIAEHLCIDEKTLRRCYPEELARPTF
jgi:hypothetical protein